MTPDKPDGAEGLPIRLAELVEGRGLSAVSQSAIPLEPDRWLRQLSGQEAALRSLPESLSRESVRRYCDEQARDAAGVVATFIASQVWGYGDRGYGPHRVAEALAHPDAVPALQCAADELDAGEPAQALEALCVVFELPRVGMSFGSKYLFFADRQRRALILDRLVCRWLAANADMRLRMTRHPASYRRWLEAASRWATELGIGPEQVELLIFTDALPEGSQWRSPRSAGPATV